MGAIALKAISKTFDGDSEVVDQVSLEIADGEFLVLVGPSGCGKSTLLRMIAGIEEVTSGQILIEGQEATHALPKERDIAMVFQSYALYPHMTVAGNLHFALRLRKVPTRERNERVAEVIRMLRLEGLENRRPGQLSGGQRQRVAMGRAMVREPAAFLMDEPLSNLDAKLRVLMRAELARLHERLGVTTVYVTHDQTEAMTLGTRVAVLKEGRLQQVGTPQELFRAPANVFVAAFIGSPTINLVEATLDSGRLRFGAHDLGIPNSPAPGRKGPVICGIRPSDYELAEFGDPVLPRMSVVVELVEHLGSEMHVLFGVEAARVDADALGGTPSNGATDDLMLADEGRSLFTAILPGHHQIRAGERIELAVDTSRALYFDPDSGKALSGPDTATGLEVESS